MKKELKNPTSPVKIGIPVILLLSRKLSKPAPEITGIANINENFAASFDGIPNNIAVQMVIPDLETPGIIAIA